MKFARLARNFLEETVQIFTSSHFDSTRAKLALWSTAQYKGVFKNALFRSVVLYIVCNGYMSLKAVPRYCIDTNTRNPKCATLAVYLCFQYICSFEIWFWNWILILFPDLFVLLGALFVTWETCAA